MEKSSVRLKRILVGMKCRCNGTAGEHSLVNYKNRGITVCDLWLNSTKDFMLWAMENGYTPELSIDRINNDKGYSPDNCRWTDQSVQSANTRVLYKHNVSGFRGVSWNKQYGKWEVSISVDRKTVKVGYYDTTLESAMAYDTYIRDNNLPHTTNNTVGRVESSKGKLLLSSNVSGYVGVSAPKRIAHLKNCWFTQIQVKGERVFSKYTDSAMNAAILREQYIKDNNLPNKLNFQ